MLSFFLFYLFFFFSYKIIEDEFCYIHFVKKKISISFWWVLFPLYVFFSIWNALMLWVCVCGRCVCVQIRFNLRKCNFMLTKPNDLWIEHKRKFSSLQASFIIPWLTHIAMDLFSVLVILVKIENLKLMMNWNDIWIKQKVEIKRKYKLRIYPHVLFSIRYFIPFCT